MAHNIYALLVGIDKYISPVPLLKGCVNDIKAIKEYLEASVATDGYQLHLRTLLNQDATRQAIIDGFRQHLAQARSNDVVLFYYSGHGSQEQAPKEVWHYEPDRLNETLVCYDSRHQEGWDLADKELAKLIAEVSAKSPHICVVLDCCHSGSGTRNLGVRRIPVDKRYRPIESYIFALDELEPLTASRSLGESFTGWRLSKGRHILLCACLDSEEAKEYYRDGQMRGAFSYFLLETLQQINGKITYRDLFKQVSALVRSHVSMQSPQLEVAMSGDENQFFLDGAIAERVPYFSVSHDRIYGWVIDGGAVHGLRSPVNSETTILALFPYDSQTENLHDSSQSLGEAQVTAVFPQLSQVSLSGIESLTPECTFKAVIVSLPLPHLGIYLEGEAEGVNLARQAIQTVVWGEKPSAYVCEEPDLTKARFRLLCRERQYAIARPSDESLLVERVDGYTSNNARKTIQRLEHISRWTTTAELSSPATSRIRPGDIEMELEFESDILQQQEMRLEYEQRGQEWRSPAFRLRLANKSQKTLYCALINLTERYAISAPFFEAGSVRLEPHEEAWALNGEYLELEVPDELWQQGITEYKDIIKLIVSTAEFDVRLLTQEALDLPRPERRNVPPPHQSTLNRLMNRVQQRDIKPRTSGRYDDWYTEALTITTVRPLAVTPVSRTQEQDLGMGVKLQPHPYLKADVCLTSVSQASRDLGNHILPPILRENSQITQAFQFTTSRGTAPVLNVLELKDVQDYTVITADTPLKLVVNTPLAETEHLLPISYDGEFFLPLGRGKKTQSGETEIELQRLPSPVSSRRSLQGAIRIFFQKVASEKFGLEFKYPVLAVAEVRDDLTVSYEANEAKIKQKVAKAKRIILYIHGIVGDTKTLVSSVRQPLADADAQRHSINQLYDLVLTFDYETINTSIEENARHLKQRLTAVGLWVDCGKTVDVVAHSMGGLVARWLIEREEGNRVIQHLVMLGTPNAGSPWPTIQDWAILALGIGLNSISSMAWPVAVLGSLVSAIQTVDVALDQMKPNSDLLQSLAASEDPSIPYSVIAGNTSIIPAALQEQESSLLSRLMERLLGQVTALPFFGQPNDIAATVHSIKNLPSGRSHPAFLQEVACDHFTYFTSREGLKALRIALAQQE